LEQAGTSGFVPFKYNVRKRADCCKSLARSDHKLIKADVTPLWYRTYAAKLNVVW